MVLLDSKKILISFLAAVFVLTSLSPVVFADQTPVQAAVVPQPSITRCYIPLIAQALPFCYESKEFWRGISIYTASDADKPVVMSRIQTEKAIEARSIAGADPVFATQLVSDVGDLQGKVDAIYASQAAASATGAASVPIAVSAQRAETDTALQGITVANAGSPLLIQKINAFAQARPPVSAARPCPTAAGCPPNPTPCASAADCVTPTPCASSIDCPHPSPVVCPALFQPVACAGAYFKNPCIAASMGYDSGVCKPLLIAAVVAPPSVVNTVR